MDDIPSLPKFMTRENTCFFTGHRSIPSDTLTDVTLALQKLVVSLYREGFRYFLCGGAMGFDMLAEQTVIKAARFTDEIHLVLALPCRNQTERWGHSEHSLELLREYQRIKGMASHIVYLSNFYYDGCMRKRNQFMVDNSSLCVTYYNGSNRGGTAQTVRFARQAGLEIRNIYGGSFDNPVPVTEPASRQK